VQFGAGFEHQVWKTFKMGLDGRFHQAGNQTNKESHILDGKQSCSRAPHISSPPGSHQRGQEAGHELQHGRFEQFDKVFVERLWRSTNPMGISGEGE